MAWRKTGSFHAAVEIVVLTCDVCERDIGHEDGRRPREHFLVSCHPNRGAMDDQQPAVVVCSRKCLRAYSESPDCPDFPPLAGPERAREKQRK